MGLGVASEPEEDARAVMSGHQFGTVGVPIQGGCSSRNDLGSSVLECISDISQNAFHEHSEVAKEALLAFWHFPHWAFAKKKVGPL